MAEALKPLLPYKAPFRFLHSINSSNVKQLFPLSFSSTYEQFLKNKNFFYSDFEDEIGDFFFFFPLKSPVQFSLIWMHHAEV